MTPEFREQVDYNDCICPYCGYSYQVEVEDFYEDPCEEECGGCEKKFYLSQSLSVDHHSKPDCILNGEEHKWSPVDISGGKTHDFCSVCNKCRPHASTEGRAHGE